MKKEKESESKWDSSKNPVNSKLPSGPAETDKQRRRSEAVKMLWALINTLEAFYRQFLCYTDA